MTALARLASPLSAMRARYDVSSSVRATAAGGRAQPCGGGKTVCVLERGTRIRYGEFPSRFPDLRREMQVAAPYLEHGCAVGALRRARRCTTCTCSSAAASAAVRSSTPASRCKPDPRVFADRDLARAIRQDGSLEQGYARARLARGRIAAPRAREMTKFKAFEKAGAPRHALLSSRRWWSSSPIPSTLPVSLSPRVRIAAIAAAAVMSAPRTPSR